MADDDDDNVYNDEADQDQEGGNSNNNARICKVYDKEDFFTVLVQLLLAAFALGSLYIKRHQERPRRTFTTWFLDVSKQAAGACYAHVLNMVIAAVISRNIRGDTVLEDQCAWYGLSYLIDTTLGLFLAVAFLRLLDHVANERDWVHLKHSGVYTGPGGWWSWIAQCTAWLWILTVVKLIIYLFMWLGSDFLAHFGAFLFAPLQGNIRFELLFVMILFPGVLNVIYFWVADSFLKAKSEHAGAHEQDDDHNHHDCDESGLQDKKEPLMESAQHRAEEEEQLQQQHRQQQQHDSNDESTTRKPLTDSYAAKPWTSLSGGPPTVQSFGSQQSATV